MLPEDDMEELLETYGSREAIESAAREKEEAEDLSEDIGVMVKGYPKVQRELDLHGMTGSEAMFELQNFIDRSIHQRVLTVRVITGKGLHSKHFVSVLPEKTEKKLAEMKRSGKVLAFRRERDGGAFTIYLIS